MDGPLVSIVIPTYQEIRTLRRCVYPLLDQEAPFEVLVVDGGSTDGTQEAARSFPGVRVAESDRGRARQMNRGARLAQGSILWFLHADSRPAAGSVSAIRRALAGPEVSGGAFRFQIDGDRRAYRLIEAGVGLRSRWLRLPYGDQGLFLRRGDFDAIGGYREVPVFEDVYLVREIRRRGKLVVLDLPLLTSSRRWESRGVAATTYMNLKLVVLEKLGVVPKRLAELRAGGSRGTGPRRAGE